MSGVEELGRVTVHMDAAAIREFVNNPSGRVVALFRRNAEEIAVIARDRVGDKYAGVQPPKAGRKPLRESIFTRFSFVDEGFHFEVLADNPIAFMHHEGTSPHYIYPNNYPKGRLRWVAIGGEVVYAHIVLHPGTAPNPYLTDALAEFYGAHRIQKAD